MYINCNCKYRHSTGLPGIAVFVIQFFVIYNNGNLIYDFWGELFFLIFWIAPDMAECLKILVTFPKVKKQLSILTTPKSCQKRPMNAPKIPPNSYNLKISCKIPSKISPKISKSCQKFP